MRSIFLIALCFCLVFPWCEAYASSGRDVREAGKLMGQTKYKEALEKYDEALKTEPEDPVINYNRAVALFRNGEFSRASDAFITSFSGGEDAVAERAAYNVGNSKYRLAEKMDSMNPQKALSVYKDAAKFYKKSMQVSPNDMDSKVNYEITLKKIKDLEKQQDQKQKDQDQQQQQDQKKDQEDQQDNKQDQQDQQQQQDQKKDKEDQQDNKQDQQDQQQQQDQKKDQEDQQDNKQDQQDQQNKDRKEQDEKEKKQEKQDQQDQKKQDKMNEGSRDKQQDQGEGDNGGKNEKNRAEPDRIGGGSLPHKRPSSGDMSEDEARMMLKGQEEDEARLRAELSDKRSSGRPSVVKNW